MKGSHGSEERFQHAVNPSHNYHHSGTTRQHIYGYVAVTIILSKTYTINYKYLNLCLILILIFIVLMSSFKLYLNYI
jgi:hypothetical protein